MIQVDQGKCRACGLCAEICHEGCIADHGGSVVVDHTACSKCTQCIAICPQQALSWDGLPPLAYQPERLPSPESLDELLKERRTVRRFRPQKIDRALLEEIVRYGTYAPMHGFHFRLIVADDPEVIQLVDDAILGFIRRLYKLVFKPRIVGALVDLLGGTWREEFAKARPKLQAGVEKGSGLGDHPAALVFVIGDRRVPLAEDSAQYILYNINLAAQVRGLGGRNLVGNQMITNRSRALRQRLGLARHERILATIGLGYPAVKFRNKVMGRDLPLQWNGPTQQKDKWPSAGAPANKE